MTSYTRLISINNDIATTYENTYWRLNDKAFTRNRKMNYVSLVKSIILKKGQTLSLELDEITDDMKLEKITKQAYSKQRKNLNPKVFKHLNNNYIRKIYEEIDVIKYKGYIVLSIDGSTVELPNSVELKEYYGLSEGQKGSVGRVRARILGVYDSLNRIMVNTNIDPYSVSEKEQILKLLDDIIEFYKDEKILMIFDRYYFGINFISKLEDKDIKYLMRMRENQYKKEKEQMKSEDEEVRLKVRSNSVFYATEEEKERLKAKKYVETRIIKIKLAGETEEHLSTNLSKDEVSKEEARELYFVRWNIEKSFDIIKNKINIENFSSKNVIGVEQEFYAQMMVYNMLEDIKRDVDEEKKQGLKYEYKVNMNILAGIFKRKFVEVLMAPTAEESIEKYKKMIDKIKKYIVPIKPGRKFPRNRMHSMNKYRSNLRRNI